MGNLGITGLAISPSGTCLHASTLNGVFDFETQPGGYVPVPVAALLTTNRAVKVGDSATVFATIINLSSIVAQGWSIGLVSGIPALRLSDHRSDDECADRAAQSTGEHPAGTVPDLRHLADAPAADQCDGGAIQLCLRQYGGGGQHRGSEHAPALRIADAGAGHDRAGRHADE